jgi:hypothetical protein
VHHPAVGYDFTEIPYGQLPDSVDEFYKDFRNKNIHINVALWMPLTTS